MSDYLASVKRARAVARDTYDGVSEDGERIQFSSRRTIHLDQPNKLNVEYSGDDGKRRVCYDGKTVSLLNRKEKVYTVKDAPDTIAGLLDYMANSHGFTIPLTDFFYPSAYDALLPGTQTGSYVGKHQVGMHRCHHLAFVGESIDWELWIKADEIPLPRKLRLTYKLEPSKPRYTALILTWEANPTMPAGVFEFKAPAGASKIDFLPADSSATTQPVDG